jgi:hypothetical protein
MVCEPMCWMARGAWINVLRLTLNESCALWEGRNIVVHTTAFGVLGYASRPEVVALSWLHYVIIKLQLKVTVREICDIFGGKVLEACVTIHALRRTTYLSNLDLVRKVADSRQRCLPCGALPTPSSRTVTHLLSRWDAMSDDGLSRMCLAFSGAQAIDAFRISRRCRDEVRTIFDFGISSCRRIQLLGVSLSNLEYILQ